MFFGASSSTAHSGTKALLLHNGNKYTSFPLAHSLYLKEGYNSVKTLLDNLKYDESGWEVI